MLANGRHGLDGALEAVKGVLRSSRNHFETLVVLVTTDLTVGHDRRPRWSGKFLMKSSKLADSKTSRWRNSY
jgi:hypothetical protein